MLSRMTAALLVSATLAFAVPAQAIEVGKPAPDCSLNALGSSPAGHTAAHRGKVMYVDFWASWCVPCAKSFPFLNKLDADLRDKGLQIVGVNVDEQSADAEAFLKKRPANFAVGNDAQGDCPKAFGVVAMPSAYVVDRQGIVRAVHYGFRESDQEDLRRTVEKLLSEPVHPAEQTAAATTSKVQ